MKCPKCGKEMRAGEVDVKRPVIFSPDDERGRFPEKHIKLRGLLDAQPIRAEICKECRCVIMDY